MIRHSAFAIIVVLSCVPGCASTPVEDRFYSLVLAADSVGVRDTDSTPKSILVIDPVQLPPYLDQRGLALQTGPNEIQAANHHFWAEPLGDGITKVLVKDVSVQASGVRVERSAGRWTPNSNCRVRIEFDKFHATTQSTIDSSGRFWILSSENNDQTEFDLSSDLNLDGYAHAVDVMRDSLGLLAQQIADAVSNHSACLANEN